MERFLWILMWLLKQVSAEAPVCRMLQKDVFDCSGLSLRQVPDQLPFGLHRLDLSQNLLQNLTELDLSSGLTLQTLDLKQNQLSFLQPGLFQLIRHLEVLDLSRNVLSTFASLNTPLGLLPSLRTLDLSHNGLHSDMSDVFLSNAPVLSNLSMHGNSITKISRSMFNGTNALRSIDLHNNVIIEIEDGAFEELPKISDLDLSVNSISCITDFNLMQLRMLNLSRNSLSSFQTIDSEQPFHLETLDLRENRLLYFPVLPRRNQLAFLDLSRNLLRSLNCTGPREELESLRESGYLIPEFESTIEFPSSERQQALPSLLYLDLSFNQLKAIPESFFTTMAALKSLNISNNCLRSFRIEHLSSLKTLDLSFNSLQSLSVSEGALAALESLHLQGNGLRMLSSEFFLRLPSINSLHLEGNQLGICPPGESSAECIFLACIPTLKYLYMSQNGLMSVPEGAFKGSPLLILDLSLNPGISIAPGALFGLEASLTHLSLRGNEIQALSVDFSLFSKLKLLDLSENRLASVALWSSGSVLESLNLQSNRLETLAASTVLALQPSLQTLFLGSNPLSCCRNIQLLMLIQEKRIRVPDNASATCWISSDGQRLEVSMGASASVNNKQEYCNEGNGSVLWISLVVALVLGVALVTTVLMKLGHSRKHRFTRGIKA
ncbi:hypothetical protein DNTS_000492 [Danionella cerebrum]|uniref:LRRCT domain-containing protein n=1 Tax=Danionella cerebrum TaxID=2873325 RepID=A0A553RNW0_9TELE|nr:hypothetical protein DNTS_000492 [Danionella translucida]